MAARCGIGCSVGDREGGMGRREIVEFIRDRKGFLCLVRPCLVSSMYPSLSLSLSLALSLSQTLSLSLKLSLSLTLSLPPSHTHPHTLRHGTRGSWHAASKHWMCAWNDTPETPPHLQNSLRIIRRWSEYTILDSSPTRTMPWQRLNTAKVNGRIYIRL